MSSYLLKLMNCINLELTFSYLFPFSRTWGTWAGPEGNVYSLMKYEHGTGCWQGPNRSTTVRLYLPPVSAQLCILSSDSSCRHSALLGKALMDTYHIQRWRITATLHWASSSSSLHHVYVKVAVYWKQMSSCSYKPASYLFYIFSLRICPNLATDVLNRRCLPQ